jgi:hypothetical protein
MNRPRQFHLRSGLILATCAFLTITLAAHASDHQGDVTEEFHQTYALSPNGRVELDNINGAVHISTWDQNEVKVDAVKSAGTERTAGRGPHRDRLGPRPSLDPHQVSRPRSHLQLGIAQQSGQRRIHPHRPAQRAPRRDQADQRLTGRHRRQAATCARRASMAAWKRNNLCRPRRTLNRQRPSGGEVRSAIRFLDRTRLRERLHRVDDSHRIPRRKSTPARSPEESRMTSVCT